MRIGLRMIPLLSASIVLQFVAAGLAIRLARVSGRWRGWLLVATAVALMAARRSLSFYAFLEGQTATKLDLSAEMVALAISILICIGLYLLTPAVRRLDEVSRRAESQKEELARLGAIVESSQDAIIAKDLEGRIVAWNAGAEVMYGYTSKEAMGQPISILVPPDREDEMNEVLRKVSMGERIRHFETVRKHKDGHLIDISLTISTIHDGSHRVSGASDVARDITRERQAERRFRHAFEAAPNAMLLVDRSGKVSAANAMAVRYFGFETSELLGLQVEMLIPDRFRADHPAHRKSFLEQPSTRPMGVGRDLFAMRKDGSEFPVEIGLNPIQLEGNFQILCAIVDITQRKRAEAELRAAAERTRRIVESALDAVVIMDETGAITDWNPHAETTFGWKKEEALGKTVAELLIPEKLRDAHRMGQRRFLETGEGPALNRRLEMTALRRNGEEFPVELTISPIREPDGRWSFSGFVRDITERVQMEAALRTANEGLESRVKLRTSQLEAVNKELESFSYTVSHDLRAPLRHIDGFLEIFMEQAAHKLDDKDRDCLKMVSESAQKMDRLVEGILTFSRLGQTKLEPTSFALGPMVDDIRKFLATTSDTRKITWKISPLPEISGDAILIRQVFINMISNAIKFSSKQSEPIIEIGTMNHPDEDIVFVRDNGVGFNMKYADKLFGAFQRLHTDEEFSGSGIGLAFVKRIVHRHGGRTWAVGESGKGATFFVALPKVKGRVLA